MTREDIKLLVREATSISEYDAYRISGNVGGGRFDKNHRQLIEQFCASPKKTWWLMRYLIKSGVYPICAVCGHPILVSDGQNMNGLTRGHIIPKSHGGANTTQNSQPEHRRCNEQHADTVAQLENWSMSFVIEISIRYAAMRPTPDYNNVELALWVKPHGRRRKGHHR